MKPKKKIITDKEQLIAANILTAFMFAQNMDEVQKVWHELYEAYALCDDPFTHCPCSSKEAIENRLEYERQVMIERYGHCDGLD